MDILSPNLMWINNRCYRINPGQENTDYEEAAAKIDMNPVNQPYIEEDLYNDDEDNDDYEIIQIDKERFKTTFHVPNVFYALIIGAKGTTRKRIETETKTTVKVPRIGQNGDIEITGLSRNNVASARRRIDLITIGARDKQEITHIICVPVTDSMIRSNFERLKAEILNGPPIYGVDESLFLNVNRLHITICGLVLLDNDDRILSANLLEECQKTIIRPKLEKCGNFEFTVNGIECMNDDLSSVNVLYAKVQSDSLQSIANEIADFFINKGLLKRKYDYVKLHMTIMNTINRKNLSSTNNEINPDILKQQTFDATDILKKYENYNFGVQKLNEIHLSQRYTKACNGFYEATAFIKF